MSREKVKTFCPKCRSQRSDKRDKSLSVNVAKGVWKCHYCGWVGSLHVGERRHTKPAGSYRRPAPRPMPAGLSGKWTRWFEGRGISESTLKALRVGEGEQLMPQTGRRESTVQFNYYLGGELINVKYRTADKHFMMERDAELIPYNLDAITGGEDCIVTEGEMDALSMVEAGLERCVSVPNGASSNLSYLDDFIEGWFDDKRVIYIAVDTDRKGLELRGELLRRFGAERCRVVTYGDDCKDANEHLMKYGKDSLRRCVLSAKEVKEEGVFTLEDIEESVDLLYREGMPKGVAIGLPGFDELCTFETGRLAVITGVPGSGKSEFIDHIAERLAVMHGWKTAFFSPENSPLQYHVSKLMEKLTGKRFGPETLRAEEYERAKSYVRENFYFISPREDFSVESILAKGRYLVRRYGVKVLVIDPYNRIDVDGGGKKETDAVRDILRKLISFAQQYDVLLFLMAHPAKPQLKDRAGSELTAPTLYDIAGSAHFFNMTDYGIIVHRPKVSKVVEVKVSKVRFKHLGATGSVVLDYNPDNGRYSRHVENLMPDYDNGSHLCEKLL